MQPEPWLRALITNNNNNFYQTTCSQIPAYVGLCTRYMNLAGLETMMSGPWHGMAQVGSRLPVTMQAHAQSQATQCGVCGGGCGTG
jgi:hypothetical protein